MRRLVVWCAVLIASGAAAQEMRLPPGRWWENPHIVREVDLSQHQRDQIRTLVYEHVRRMVDLKADVERASIDLKDRVDRDVLDVEAVRRAYGTFQEARMALDRERFELLLAVRQVFSVEQWKRLERLRELGESRRAPVPRRQGERPRP